MKREHNEQIEHLKQKIQELKDTNQELQVSNNHLNSENARLLLDVKMRDRYEQTANQMRFENDLLKAKM